MHIFLQVFFRHGLLRNKRTIMSSSAVIDKLKAKADQTDAILVKLKAQLESVRETHAKTLCRQEEERLKAENAQLKQEVEQLKKQLVFLEYRNGEKQIPMPHPKGSSGIGAVKPDQPTMPTVVASPIEEKVKQDVKKEEKQPKEKKDKGKKAGGAAVDDRPVDVSRLNMKVGIIVDVKHHPDADSLYMETVDVGEDKPRTILSGLVKHIPIEEMKNRKAVFMVNLKPAKMRGIMSEGMIMCASTPEKVEILNLPDGCQPGDRVTFDGYPGEPDPMLNPKKKIWEQVAPDLRVDVNGVATYKGAPFKIEGKGLCVAPTLKNVPVK